MLKFHSFLADAVILCFALEIGKAFHPNPINCYYRKTLDSLFLPFDFKTNKPRVLHEDVSKIFLPCLSGLFISFHPAMAIDTNADIAYQNKVQQGAKIFDQSCVMCHANGKNAIAKQRDLSKAALDQYIGLDAQSIKRFIQDSNVHRGALAFSAKLSDIDYENVCAFVYDQAMESKW